MKPILILQLRPIDEVADNEFQAFLHHGGLQEEETHRIRMERESVAGIDLTQYAGVIMGGGPSNISDDEAIKPEFQRRFEAELFPLFDQLFELDLPYLGSCYGLGALINYADGLVSKAQYGEQAGPTTIFLQEAAKTDALLAGLPLSFLAFVGHKEACQFVPEGGTLLAGSEACPVQIIRFKQNIYATQFHVELDAQGMIVRIQNYRNHGYFDPASAETLIQAVKKVEAQVPHQILRRFVARCREA